MQRGTRKRLWIALGAIGAFLAAYLILLLLGSVVIEDREGQIVSATIVGSNGAAQPMHRVPGGLFVAIPRIEGEVVVHCRNGTVGRGGYVTPHMDERLKVTGACGVRPR